MALPPLQRNLLAGLFFLGGVTFTVAVSFQLHREQIEINGRDFENRIDAHLNVVDREFRMNVEALYTLKVLFDGSEEVLHDEFHRAVNNTLTRHPDLRALEWVPVVPAKRRALVESARSEILPNFIITELTESGQLRRAGERAVYYPVYYVEPLAGNEAELGFDLGSERHRLALIEQARDQASLVISESIELVQTTDDDSTMLFMLPVYGSAQITLEQRRESFRGVVVAAMSLKWMFGLPDNPIFAVARWVELVERMEDGEVRSLARYGKTVSDTVFERCIETINARTWCLRGQPMNSINGRTQRFVPLLILLSGLGLFAVLAFIFYQLSRRNQIIEKLVKERTVELDEANLRLIQLSSIDELTKLKNRRSLEDALEYEWRRLMRDKLPLSIMMIDIDEFKQYNDYYGHLAGDDCLRKVAQALLAQFSRPADLVARYGGEEFLILLPNTVMDVALLAARCRESVRELKIPHVKSSVADCVTVSIGVATNTPVSGHSPWRLVESADQALYEAKNRGRDRVCLASASSG